MTDAFPSSPDPNLRTNQVAYAIIDPDNMINGYFDLAGKFPQRSSSGNQYVLVGYNFDANSILATPFKNRTAPILTQAWKTLHNKYTQAAVAPQLYILDNEFSAELEQALNLAGCQFQLVPPHAHRNNLAERAIQTWKSHF